VTLSPNDAIGLVKSKLWPMLSKERERVERIDRWMRWDHDAPHSPRWSTREYKQLLDRSQAPWGRRVVTAVTDQMFVDGYRMSKAADNVEAWRWWLANGFDYRQIAIHESVTGYGIAYSVVLPGKSWLGEPLPMMRALDPSQMIAVYDDPAWDDWPVYALRASPKMVGSSMGWQLRLYEAEVEHRLVMTASGDSISYIEARTHGQPVCPVVRYTTNLDLRGRATGDVEPIIPVLGRIDQTTYDRLMAQHFGSWKVRTIAGMTPPDHLDGETDEEYRTRTKQRLRQDDILVADDPDTKFGTLDETPLDGLINAHDADVRVLAAVSQSPAHELIGQMANLSAEALAAAEASLTRRVRRTQRGVGVGHKQTLRLAALVMGNETDAADVEAEVMWSDLESRSLAQEADALGKLATMLGIPVEILWDKVSILTQTDVERAKQLAAQAGGMEALLAQLAGGAGIGPAGNGSGPSPAALPLGAA